MRGEEIRRGMRKVRNEIRGYKIIREERNQSRKG
jgi:hypothetical protein